MKKTVFKTMKVCDVLSKGTQLMHTNKSLCADMIHKLLTQFSCTCRDKRQLFISVCVCVCGCVCVCVCERERERERERKLVSLFKVIPPWIILKLLVSYVRPGAPHMLRLKFILCIFFLLEWFRGCQWCVAVGDYWSRPGSPTPDRALSDTFSTLLCTLCYLLTWQEIAQMVSVSRLHRPVKQPVCVRNLQLLLAERQTMV